MEVVIAIVIGVGSLAVACWHISKGLDASDALFNNHF